MSSNPPILPQDAQAVELQKQVGTIQVDKTPGDVMRAYFATGLNTTYIMANGTKVVFAVGTVPSVPLPAFVTKIKGYIDELDRQIAEGHPVIHTLSGYETITVDQLDPHDAVKKQAVADFLKSEDFKKYVLQERGVGTPADSNTSQSPILAGIANSDDVSDAASGSDSSVSAKLAAMSAPKK